MSQHLRALGRGFNWLAGATLVAKIVDFSTILVMLTLLTKAQVGVASLAMSIGMVVEAFNGLGTSEAMIQARIISRAQLDTLFWYIVGAACIVGALVLLAAPAIAHAYGTGLHPAYFAAIAAKQPLVGAAVIPLAIMNRRLRYERIAIVNVCATFAAAATRLALGFAGAGAWALVAGYVASGLYTLVGASIAQPFRPRLRLRFAATQPLMRFGLRATAANFAEQTFKNIDYLLVGAFYGAAPLAVYRVAFDIAMEPAMAVGTVVNRAALPVFARVATSRADLAGALAWGVRRIATLVAPLMAAIALAAVPLTGLLHDHAGHSYAAAAVPLEILAAAATLRLVVQLLATAMMGAGRPAMAARLSAMTLVLLGGGVLAAGATFSVGPGLVAVSVVWLLVYPALLAWALRGLQRAVGLAPGVVLRGLVVPLLATASLVAMGLLVRPGNPFFRIGLVLAMTGAVYAGLLLPDRRR